jgi:putative tryptophan/tyrosine transport system substrate-binding protein
VRRRDFITLLGGAAAASICGHLTVARAEPTVRRIGILSQGYVREHPTALFQAFREGMREFGWIEGRNLAIEWRFSEGSAEPLPRLAAELVGLPVDLIVAAPSAPALAAKEATKNASKASRAAAGAIPVVFVQVPDPVRMAVVSNLARPGANVTGLSSIASDLSGKRLALLKEVLPGASRVAVLWNRPSQGAALVVQEMSRVRGEVGLELIDVGVSDRSELEEAFAKAAREHVAAMMVIDDPVIASLQTPVVALATRHRLPIFSLYSPYVDAGGLMAYGPSLIALYRRAAGYVDRILKGAQPSDLPIEQPTVFELVINLNTANALGLELAPNLVARADRVIE